MLESTSPGAVPPGAAVLPRAVVNSKPLYGRNSKVRPVDSPLAWLGNDRLLLDDVNQCGIHRRVIACKGEMPHQVQHLLIVYQRVPVEKVHWRIVWREYEPEVFWFFLWIWWKEG